MIKRQNGLKIFYQWDLDQQLQLTEIEGDLDVHFWQDGQSNALVVEPTKDGDVQSVAVPNILLQNALPIKVYIWRKDIGAWTAYQQVFQVIGRGKPADYVYTETECRTVDAAVEKALEEAKASGDFKGEQGPKGDDYVLTDADKQEIADIVIDNLPTDDGGGTNADWSQNDETQPDYVKNRTHYVIESGKKYEFDCDTDTNVDDTKKFIFPEWEEYFYQICNIDIPSYNELIGGSYETFVEGTTETHFLTPATGIEQHEGCFLVDGWFIVVYDAKLCGEYAGNEQITNGIYVYCSEDNTYYISNIATPDKVLQIDPKYIPPLPYLRIGDTFVTEEQLKEIKRRCNIYN